MAFNKENFYTEGNSQEYFFTRTNPTANKANAEILKIKKSGCCECSEDLFLELSYDNKFLFTEVSFGGRTATPALNKELAEGEVASVEQTQTAGRGPGYLNDCTPRYFKITITDGQGGFATNTITDFSVPTPSPFIVDTSALNPQTTWQVIVITEYNSNPAVDCPCMTEYTFTWIPLAGTFVFDSYALTSAKASYYLNGELITFDVPEYDLGTFVIGQPGSFTLGIKNIGDLVVEVSSVNPDGVYVLTSNLPQYAGIIYPNNTTTITCTIDTSLVAGTYNGSVFISDNVFSPNVNIKYTLA